MGWLDITLQIGIPVFTIIFSSIFGFSKNKKVKKMASNILLITEMSKKFIVEAEQKTNYTGLEKKQFVITRLLKFIVDNSIQNISEETLSDIIENEVSLTNEVNVDKKKLSQHSMTIVNEPSEMPTSHQVL